MRVAAALGSLECIHVLQIFPTAAPFHQDDQFYPDDLCYTNLDILFSVLTLPLRNLRGQARVVVGTE